MGVSHSISLADSALEMLLREIAVHYGWPEDWPKRYGAKIDNPIFMMHPFCWCEDDDCPWCMGCTCPESAYYYFVDNQEVSRREWDAFYQREVYEPLGLSDYDDPRKATFYPEILARGALANLRREVWHEPECPFCKGERFAELGAIAKKRAPNFWHKPSGFRVWWYKYIGRDMETNLPITNELLDQIRKDCLP